MGSPDQRLAARELLRQRAPRVPGCRFAQTLRRLLRHQRRPGIRLTRQRRQLDADCPRSAVRAVGGGADAGVMRTWSSGSLIAYELQISMRAILNCPDQAQERLSLLGNLVIEMFISYCCEFAFQNLNLRKVKRCIPIWIDEA